MKRKRINLYLLSIAGGLYVAVTNVYRSMRLLSITNVVQEDLPITRALSEFRSSRLEFPLDFEKIQLYNKSTNSTSTKKTRAVIHMGVHKTGTSSIQKQSEELTDQLKLDGYEMPWRIIQEGQTKIRGRTNLDVRGNQVNFATCFLNSSEHATKVFPCNMALLNAGSEIAKREKNLLVSAETFSLIEDEGLQALVKYLSQWDDTTVVVYHRRFHSWMLSTYNQMYKGMEKLMDGIRNEMSIVDYIESVMTSPSISVKQYSYFLLKRLKRHFGDKILVMDYHDKSHGGSDVSFFCHAMPDATNTCNSISIGEQIHSNAAWTFDYEDLAYGAKSHGLIDIESVKDMYVIAWQIQKFQEQSMKLKSSDFKRICPKPDTMKRFWEFSLMVEKSLFPHRFAGDETYLLSLKSEFDVMATTTLCKLDVDGILSEKRWITFLKNLQTRYNFKKNNQKDGRDWGLSYKHDKKIITKKAIKED